MQAADAQPTSMIKFFIQISEKGKIVFLDDGRTGLRF